jgi:hypothetical protein
MKADAPVLRGQGAPAWLSCPFCTGSLVRYGLPALKASRISAQTGPERVHHARCAAAAPVRSAVTIDGSGFESIATPFWRMR